MTKVLELGGSAASDRMRKNSGFVCEITRALYQRIGLAIPSVSRNQTPL